MKTQKLSLNLVVGLTVLNCLLAVPMRANAGPEIIPGTGSIASGVERIFTNPVLVQVAPTVRINNLFDRILSNPFLSVEPQTQSELNIAATQILERYQDVNMLSAVVENKSLVENGETPIVDINMLNAAIEDYNNIVISSSPEELQRLATDTEFIRTGEMLNELRKVLSQK